MKLFIVIIIFIRHSKIVDQDLQDPKKFNGYLHYEIMDHVDPDTQFFYAPSSIFSYM